MIDPAPALKELATSASRDETIKQMVERAARLTGLSYWRTFDLWYDKARNITDEEREAISIALAKRRLEADRNEARELRVRLTRLEARLLQTDEDFYREEIGQIRNAVRGRG
jgi:hypothetical protein